MCRRFGNHDGGFIGIGDVDGDGLCGRQGAFVGGNHVKAVAWLCLKVCGGIQCNGTGCRVDGKQRCITTAQAVEERIVFVHIGGGGGVDDRGSRFIFGHMPYCFGRDHGSVVNGRDIQGDDTGHGR